MPGAAVMPQSARRWYGLPPQSPVLSCTPGSLTVTSAAACGPLLAVPAHSDWTDGRHTRGVWGHTADSAACRQFLQLASTRACGA